MRLNAGRRPPRRLGAALLLVALTAGLQGCPDVPKESWTPHVMPLYVLDPAAPEIPTPIDIPGVTVALDGSGVNVAVPEGASPAYAELFDGYINTLDGWALNSGMEFAFTATVQHETISADTVIVIDFSGPAPRRLEGLVPVAVDDPATGRTQVTIASPTPLPAGAVLGVVVRSGGDPGVLDTNGAPVVTPYTFGFLKSKQPLIDVVPNPDGAGPRVESRIVAPADTPDDVLALQLLEGLRQGYAPALDALGAGLVAGAPAVPREEVVLFWTFKTQSDTIAQFDPIASVIPTPNDLLRAGATLGFPIGEADPAAQKALFSWLNTLDGFSILSAPEVSFSDPVDAATITANSVRVFDVTESAAIAEVGDVVRVWDAGTNTLTIQHANPTAPFEHGHTYAVVVLSGPAAEGGALEGVLTPEGKRVVRSQAAALSLLTQPLADAATGASLLPGILSDAEAQQFEAVRQGIGGVVGLLGQQFGIERGNVASVWAFTTGSKGESLVDPSVGAVPTPNDLVLLESTIQGLIDDAQSDAERAFFTWLSQQGGWSAVINGATVFSQPLDRSTIESAFHVFEVSVRLGEVDDIVLELPEDASAPVHSVGFHRATAWKKGATYFAILTDDLRAADGSALLPSSFEVLVRGEDALYDAAMGSLVPAVVADADAATLEQFRALTAPALGMALEELGKTRANVLAHWTFTIHGDNETLFSPTTGFLPFPNEVLQNTAINPAADPPRPAPGILLPLEAPPGSPFADVFAYLATRDGFSVLDVATASFLGDVDPDSLVAAAAITDVPTAAVGYADITQIVLTPGEELKLEDLVTKLQIVTPMVVFDAATKSLAVGPPIGHPLKENRRMMIELTDKLASVGGAPIRVSPTYWLARSRDPLAENGKSLVASLTDDQAVQLEQLRQAYAPLFQGFDGVGSLFPGFSRDSVVLFWTYWTQSIRSELDLLGAAVAATPIDAGDIEGTRRGRDAVRNHPVLGAIIDEAPDEITILNLDEMVVDGTIPARYLLGDTDLRDPRAPQYGTFLSRDPANPQWNDAAEPIPFDLYVPNQSQEHQAPFELVVYVHGIFGRRQDVLRGGVVDALLGQGFAVMAIDLPLHGERQARGATGSGDGFLAPDLLALRDHLLQGALDLHQVANAIRTGLDPFLQQNLGRPGPVIRTDSISLMGVSLGGIVSVPFLATDPIVTRAVLHTPGGHFARVVQDNAAPWFQESVRQLLCGAVGEAQPAFCQFDPAAADYIPYAAIPWNDPNLRQILMIMQWVLDPADPVAHAPYVSAAGRQVLVQVAGDDDLFRPSIAAELAAAIQYDAGTGPALRVYDGACHAFLAWGCDGAPPSLQDVRESARDDAAAFLRDGTLAP